MGNILDLFNLIHFRIILSETVNDPWTPKFIKVSYKGLFEEFEFKG